MKKRIISARWLLTLLFFLGIGLGIGGTVVGEDLLRVVRVEGGFNLQQDLTGWVEKTASYQLYTSGNGLTLRLYAGFDRDFLYLGFAVNDPFLSFKDDYSLDFNQSDHLRVKLSPSAGAQEAVTLYLLPTSKINEPLFHISGGTLHRQGVRVHSVLNQDRYFFAMALSLAELGLTPRPGSKLPLQILIHDLTKSGEVQKHLVFTNDAQGYGLLAF
jgi:hypothetical protein